MKKAGLLCLLLMLFCVISAASAQVNVGDIITFGNYEQDNDLTNGPEPIEWNVLAVEEDRVLVMSYYGLDAKPYHTTRTDVTWETCSLRAWLNGEFYSSAFSAAEQERILQVTLKNPENMTYGTAGGRNTLDRIFLLSIDEAEQYLKAVTARQCPATAYAKANGASVNSNNGYSWWWLRTPGFSLNSAAYVGITGNIVPFGDFAHLSDAVVWPALWLSPEDGSADSTAARDAAEEAAEEPAEDDYAVGQIVTIGQYEQDNDLSNGDEPIEWQVLAAEEDRVLVISKYGLFTMPFNMDLYDVTWESSFLRAWLNVEFFRSAFNESEQQRILQVTLKNPDNPEYGTAGGNDTADRIFLLSIDEAEKYIGSNTERQCKPTAYAEANGAYVDSDSGYSWWWLRTPGSPTVPNAANVSLNGSIFTFGGFVFSTDAMVRPALWLSIGETAAPASAILIDPAEVTLLGSAFYSAEDYETALNYLIPAADAGDVYAQFRVGYMYLMGQGLPVDYEKAAYYTKLSADQGEASAQLNLGRMYAEAIGVPQSYENAVKYYQMAAEQGEPTASNNLGIMYEAGEGVDQSYEKARYYYELAAEKNSPYAQCNLGGLYYFGNGVEQSYEKAIEYFLMASEQGHPFAQFSVGWMYEHGEGVEKDVQTAISYYQLAADQGYQDAVKQLDALR